MARTIKPVLNEILLVGQVKYYMTHCMVRPCRSIVHQASNILRRRRLLFIWPTHISPVCNMKRDFF